MALAYAVGRAAGKTAARRRPQSSDRIDPYQMANLFPRSTGLPLTVWAGPRGRARYDARIKVSLTPGKMDTANTATVGLRPQPHLVRGRLAAADLEQISRWITLNEAALMDLWNGAIDGVEFAGRLRRLDPAATSREDSAN
ncbi:MAG TPA: hypothetical protein VGG99_11370 [Acetobacteraceae bacterium]|jgi:hypothetical protein